MLGDNMEFSEEMIKNAYKKLKSEIYFDKSQLILRDQIVQFESGNIDDILTDLWKNFNDDIQWEKFEKTLLSSINVLMFPKKISNKKSSITTNSAPKNTTIEEIQYFIDMNVEAHILSVLWLLTIGWKLDNETYKHSYGNRIHESLTDEFPNLTYSPYLFEPYYKQYEKWLELSFDRSK